MTRQLWIHGRTSNNPAARTITLIVATDGTRDLFPWQDLIPRQDLFPRQD